MISIWWKNELSMLTTCSTFVTKWSCLSCFRKKKMHQQKVGVSNFRGLKLFKLTEVWKDTFFFQFKISFKIFNSSGWIFGARWIFIFIWQNRRYHYAIMLQKYGRLHIKVFHLLYISLCNTGFRNFMVSFQRNLTKNKILRSIWNLFAK